jgi:hypothetical protein
VPSSRSWLTRSVPAVLAAALVVAAAWPSLQRRSARRAVEARVEAFAARGGECDLLDPGLSLRVQRLGPWLASWETVGGCGTGGGVGTGVKWVGHNTTGGLFQVMQQTNYLRLTSDPLLNLPSPGYQYMSITQITKDLSDKWSMGASIPVLYKYYYNWKDSQYDLSNGGLGDVSLLITRRLGRVNATSMTAMVGLPSARYKDSFLGTKLDPDQQLGFGRATTTLVLDHTLDQTWGLVILGTTVGYRGGKNSEHNYRAPGGSVYSYVGWFVGPLVPVLGATLTGFTRQDEVGDNGDTVNAPVATAAANASLEWSNDYVALLLGAQFPYALRGKDWSDPAAPHYGLQPWTLSLGISVSPF